LIVTGERLSHCVDAALAANISSESRLGRAGGILLRQERKTYYVVSCYPASTRRVYVLIAYWEKRERGVVFSRPLRALRAA